MGGLHQEANSQSIIFHYLNWPMLSTISASISQLQAESYTEHHIKNLILKCFLSAYRNIVIDDIFNKICIHRSFYMIIFACKFVKWRIIQSKYDNSNRLNTLFISFIQWRLVTGSISILVRRSNLQIHELLLHFQNHYGITCKEMLHAPLPALWCPFTSHLIDHTK